MHVQVSARRPWIEARRRPPPACESTQSCELMCQTRSERLTFGRLTFFSHLSASRWRNARGGEPADSGAPTRHGEVTSAPGDTQEVLQLVSLIQNTLLYSCWFDEKRSGFYTIFWNQTPQSPGRFKVFSHACVQYCFFFWVPAGQSSTR